MMFKAIHFATFCLLIFFQGIALGGGDEEEVTVTITRAPIINNPQAIGFVKKCLTLSPHTYRYTQLGRMEPVLSDGENLTPVEKKLRIRLSLFDKQKTVLGWYLVEESRRPDEKQISGILGLDSHFETGFIEASLIYLPKKNLLSQSGLTKQVFSLAADRITPHIGKNILFFNGFTPSNRPKFKQKKVQGACASIFVRNYPSLISAYRSGFRVFGLTDKTLFGHEVLLALPKYKHGSIPAIEELLDSTPKMRSLVTQSQKAIELLENKQTRKLGKLHLWKTHLIFSGLGQKVVLGIIGIITIVMLFHLI